MRLPRQDTPLRLPAEQPRQAITADEALLENNDDYAERWWQPASRAVVLGLGLHHRVEALIDVTRVETICRHAGGGALLLAPGNMLCGAIRVPTSAIPNDVTESYCWLGDHLVSAFQQLGLSAARRIEVSEARQDLTSLRARRDDLLLATCYGALSPHEVIVEGRKLVGLAQIRRRHATLFVVGVLFDDQSPLADYMRVASEAQREELRAALRERTVGLNKLTIRSASEVVEVVAGARPFVR